MFNFRNQQVLSLADSFSRAKVRHEKMFATIAELVASRVTEFKEQELKDILDVYTVLGLPSTQIRKAMESADDDQDDVKGKRVQLLLFLVMLVLVGSFVLW